MKRIYKTFNVDEIKLPEGILSRLRTCHRYSENKLKILFYNCIDVIDTITPIVSPNNRYFAYIKKPSISFYSINRDYRLSDHWNHDYGHILFDSDNNAINSDDDYLILAKRVFYDSGKKWVYVNKYRLNKFIMEKDNNIQKNIEQNIFSDKFLQQICKYVYKKHGKTIELRLAMNYFYDNNNGFGNGYKTENEINLFREIERRKQKIEQINKYCEQNKYKILINNLRIKYHCKKK